MKSLPNARVLLASQPSVGHATALIAIGRTLLSLGADVRFACPAARLPDVPLPSMLATAMTIPRAIERAGLRFVALSPSAEVMAYALAMPFSSGAWEMRIAGRMVSAGLVSATQEIEAVLRREPADVVVADFAVLAAGLAAERLRIPSVAFFHAGLPFPLHGEHPYTGGAEFSQTVNTRVGRARARLGLPPLSTGVFEKPYAPDLNLLATTPTLEGRTGESYANTHWVGPCVDGRVEDDGFPFAELQANAFKVYVSLGTVFNGYPHRFRTLISGLSGPGVQLVVSAGASYEALKKLHSSSVMIFRRVPQVRLLAAVDCVVSHGGNNTVNETLAAGLPLVVLPIGGEQESNARRVERIGAGVRLHRDRLTADAVRSAFAQLRADPKYRENAQRIAEATRGLAGVAESARLILELARRGGNHGPH